MDGVIVVCGVSHRTAPLVTRERVSLSEAGMRTVLRRLSGDPRIHEAAVLATCNRTELYAVAAAAGDGEAALRAALLRHTQAGAAALACSAYVLTGDTAVEHLFRVAAGLDSAVFGESEIAGQVRAAVARAQREGTLGVLLERAFEHALEAAGRVRRRTRIGHGSTSLAVVVARAAIAQQDERGILMVGAGRLMRSVARALRGHGAVRLMIANRTHAAALELAQAVGADAVPMPALDAALACADVVITATAAQRPILTAERLRALEPAQRPRAVFDLGVPRDVDPAAATLTGVVVEDIELLQRRVGVAVAARQGDLERADALVRREVERFAAWRREQRVAPAIGTLWRRAEALRREELARLAPLDEDERARLDAVTAALLRKLLDAPARRLRAAAGPDSPHLEVFCELFDLSAGAREAPPAAPPVAGRRAEPVPAST